MIRLVQVSDLHFGRDVDLDQIDALAALVPELAPTAVVVAGDLTQRARHGEFQAALAFVKDLRKTAPTLVIPGNHDVQWWASPFDLLGVRRKYTKYRIYFGEDLAPGLALPGVAIESLLTSHGVAVGSMTWKFWRDPAVKGHLPSAELARVAARFAAAPRDALRVVVTHQNILRGEISRRMGLARWKAAQLGLGGVGADLVLCGHDHQEGAGLLDGQVVIATSSTHTGRTRGRRPSAFNLIDVSADTIQVRHGCWDRTRRRFDLATPAVFPRRTHRSSDVPQPR